MDRKATLVSGVAPAVRIWVGAHHHLFVIHRPPGREVSSTHAMGPPGAVAHLARRIAVGVLTAVNDLGHGLGSCRCRRGARRAGCIAPTVGEVDPPLTQSGNAELDASLPEGAPAHLRR
jgi:hypothetical protein